jgi:uroporphyrinogen decarboxylase
LGWGVVASKLQCIFVTLHEKNHARAYLSIRIQRNGGPYLAEIINAGADAIGLDWTTDLQAARQLAQGKVALQGNLDPATLYAAPAQIEAAVGMVLEQYGYGSGHIFNLGHGMHPDVDPEQVSVMLEALHSQSPRYHTQHHAQQNSQQQSQHHIHNIV